MIETAHAGGSRKHDLLVTAVETNHRHGVGIFLQRLYGAGDAFACLRTHTQFGGDEPFGRAHLQLSSEFLTLAESREALRTLLAPLNIRRILAVPYYRSEFVHAVLAKELTGAPLVTYLMDDQNVHTNAVADEDVARLLAVSDAVVGISPEMCAAYAAKFHLPVALLPPVLSAAAPQIPCYWRNEPGEPAPLAMIGNVWSALRFRQLRQQIRSTGRRLHWYGSGSRAPWLEGTPEEWSQDGIDCFGHIDEEDLVSALAGYPMVVVPTGSLDAQDDKPSFSRLSLPSRMVFLATRVTTPLLVVGHRDSAAGRFVDRIGGGLCTRGEPEDLARAIERLLTDAEFRTRVDRNLHEAAELLMMSDAAEWLWRLPGSSRPPEAPFHALFEPLAAPGAKRKTTPLPSSPLPVVSTQPAVAEALADTGRPAGASEQLECSQMQGLVIARALRAVLKAGDRVLFLGDGPPPEAVRSACQNNIELWTMLSFGGWIADGFQGDPHFQTQHAGPVSGPRGIGHFDAIVSTGGLGQIAQDEHHLRGLELFLNGTLRHGGWNLHGFNAVLGCGFLWTPPAFAYLQARHTAHPGPQAILGEPAPWFMHEEAYEANWRKHIGKSASEFGRVFGCFLAWRHRHESA